VYFIFILCNELSQHKYRVKSRNFKKKKVNRCRLIPTIAIAITAMLSVTATITTTIATAIVATLTAPTAPLRPTTGPTTVTIFESISILRWSTSDGFRLTSPSSVTFSAAQSTGQPSLLRPTPFVINNHTTAVNLSSVCLFVSR